MGGKINRDRPREGRVKKKGDATQPGFLQTLIDTIPNPIFYKDAEGKYLGCNSAFESYLGCSRDEIVGKSVYDLAPKELADRYFEADNALLRNPGIQRYEATVQYADGTRHEIFFTKATFTDGNGRVAGMVGVMTDITERKQKEKALSRLQSELEERVRERTSELEAANSALQKEIAERNRALDQLRQAQKVEAVGRLAGGIAHDFNNMLTAINGFADLLIQQMKENDPMRREAEEIRKAGERAASLTRQLLAFSRRQILQPKVLDLNEVISQFERMLHRLIGEDIKLRTSYGRNLWRVKADPGQIEQAIMNLAVNSRDAMPAGGTLSIDTANVQLSEAIPVGSGAIPPGPYVLLSVSDTGCGLDDTAKSHLFEPFFTTKEQGKGTGLGLAMVYGFVKQSGGYILADSEVGKGTTFRIYLPRTGEEVRRATEEGLSEAPSAGRETVLVVEDQEEVRSLVVEILTMQGYNVLKASGGEEALRICRTARKPIDLLLTDMVMPGMGGRELAERMMRTSPGLKVILMSGYTEDGVVQWGTVIQGMEFLQKPFSVDTLARKVRKVLDA
jgi:PAS domain S-box-containing protein